MDGLDLEDVAGRAVVPYKRGGQRTAGGAAVIGAAVNGTREECLVRLADIVATARRRLGDARGTLPY